MRVTDNGSPALHDDEVVELTVLEVNLAPVLEAIADETIDEMVAYTFDADASDPDLPANTLTYSLVGAPAGASIDAATGEFSWTPSETQGPGVYTFTVRVTDNGSPALHDDEVVELTVLEVNLAPVLEAIADETIDEMVAYTFDADASDPDLPANTLTYSLVGAPAGASIDAATGEFSWTPSETQGPGVYTFTVRVTDNGSPALHDDEVVELTVLEVNLAPVLEAIGNKSVNEGSLLSFDADATDPDIPANGLTFSLADGTTNCVSVTSCLVPSGAAIDPSTGAFTWTPADNGTFRINVVVTDDGDPNLSDTEEITITVSNVNPTVTAPAGQAANEGENKSFNLGSFSDPGVNDAPWAVTVSWGDGSTNTTFTKAAPGSLGTASHSYGDNATYTVTVTVTDKDNGASSATFQVTVGNVAPVASSLIVTVDPITGETSATVSYSDAGWLDTHTAAFTWNAGAPIAGTVTPTPGSNVRPGPVTGSATATSHLDPGCYQLIVTATITDDDGSSHTISKTISNADVYLASFKAPIKDNERNIAKYGNVVPIKVEIASSCSGTLTTSPILHITIANGNSTDIEPDLSPVIVAESVSSADTGTQMRINSGGYIYNLTTKNLQQGKDYTIRIRVGSTSGPIIAKALFQPKK